MLFNNKKSLLSLYNAVNDTHYDNEDDLDITTLKNAIYMSMKNDVSCLIDMQLQLYEQQSTINPNMPLRDLMYITRQLEKLIVKDDLYSKKLVKIPTPKFIVFYNGTETQPEQKTLLLSEAFENINHDILREFLLANKVEVTSMSIFEYDEELHKKTLLKEGYEEGYDDCKKEMTQILEEKDKIIAENRKNLADILAENERLKVLLAEH